MIDDETTCAMCSHCERLKDDMEVWVCDVHQKIVDLFDPACDEILFYIVPDALPKIL